MGMSPPPARHDPGFAKVSCSRVSPSAGSKASTYTRAFTFALPVAASGVTANDVGRPISGPGIQPGTTITAWTVGTTTATLSKPATATAGSVTLVVGRISLPVGTYSLIVPSSEAAS